MPPEAVYCFTFYAKDSTFEDDPNCQFWGGRAEVERQYKANIDPGSNYYRDPIFDTKP